LKRVAADRGELAAAAAAAAGAAAVATTQRPHQSSWMTVGRLVGWLFDRGE